MSLAPVKKRKKVLLFETHKVGEGVGEDIDVRSTREWGEWVRYMFGGVGVGEGLGCLSEGCNCWGRMWGCCGEMYKKGSQQVRKGK